MTHTTIERSKLEKVFYALTAAKHGNLDHEWTEEVLAICKQALNTATPLAAQRQCNWPTCQSEAYQQSLAEQIKQELVTGAAQPAPVKPIKPSLWEQSRGITKGQP